MRKVFKDIKDGIVAGWFEILDHPLQAFLLVVFTVAVVYKIEMWWTQ